ncbi:hypothetical protein ACFLXI_08030, partial [Chloroflexota bacterium]
MPPKFKNPKEKENFITMYRSPGAPILLENSYQNFIIFAFGLWSIIVIFVWKYEIQLTISQETLTAISGTSVELAALSLTVLGLLHEFNKRDVYFKLGLLLVSIFFITVSFGGFANVVTWDKWFDSPQTITVWFLIIVVFGFLSPFVTAFFRGVFRGIFQDDIPQLLSSLLDTLDRFIPFSIPFLLVGIGFGSFNRLTSVIILFIGSIVFLICLMVITTVTVTRRSNELIILENQQLQDQAAADEDTANENDLLQTQILDTLEELLDQSQNLPEPISLITIDDIQAQLIIDNETIDRPKIQNTLSNLVRSNEVYARNLTGPYWVPLDENQIRTALAYFDSIAYTITYRVESHSAQYTIFGLVCTKLVTSISNQMKMPKEIVAKFVLPKLLERVEVINSGSLAVLVNNTLHPHPNEIIDENQLANFENIVEVDETRLNELTN